MKSKVVVTTGSSIEKAVESEQTRGNQISLQLCLNVPATPVPLPELARMALASNPDDIGRFTCDSACSRRETCGCTELKRHANSK